MNIIVEQLQGRVPVTLLKLHGDLDASNYQEVINQVQNIYTSGSINLLLDMSQVSFLSSSGIVALHSIALITQGAKPDNLEEGWNTLHRVQKDQSSGKQVHVKILNPSPKIQETLRKTGMDAFFDIYFNLDTALASY